MHKRVTRAYALCKTASCFAEYPENIWRDILFLAFILGARMYVRTYSDYKCVPETFKPPSCVPVATEQLLIMVYEVVSVNIG